MAFDATDALILAALPFRSAPRNHLPTAKQTELEAALAAIFAERAKARGRPVATNTQTLVDREGALLAFNTAMEKCRAAGVTYVDLVEAFNSWVERHPGPTSATAT